MHIYELKKGQELEGL